MSTSDSRPLWSVTELTQQIKTTLESRFVSVWVKGEISNLARPQSGHVYLTLKDDHAQIRAAIWRNAARGIRFDLTDGQEVICEGAIDVYAPRGSYQLIVRQVEPVGTGALQLAFQQLHDRLKAEGLFAPELKRPLPAFPTRIAFVTSPTGAAIRDFLQVVQRRWTGVEVLVIPCRVQGVGAAQEIANGIAAANRLPQPPDVIIAGRGGGALEDLWCFNEEPVIRAIFESRIPVVSAVGHEIDVTLSDLAADVRAATPTEAAELVVPSGEEIRSRVENLRNRLIASLTSRSDRARSRYEALASRLIFRKPFSIVHDRDRYVDDLSIRLDRAIRGLHAEQSNQISRLAAQLDSLSPLGVLARGYSVTRLPESKQLVRDASQVAAGDRIETRLHTGTLISRIEES